MKKMFLLLLVMLFCFVGNGYAQELETEQKTWWECVVDGYTPVGTKVHASIVNGEIVEDYHPFPSLEGWTFWRQRTHSVLQKVPFEESVIREYRSNRNPNELFQVIYWNGNPVVYWIFNTQTRTYRDGRGTYTPDGNFEQEMVGGRTRFWHRMHAWWPEYYEDVGAWNR